MCGVVKQASLVTLLSSCCPRGKSCCVMLDMTPRIYCQPNSFLNCAQYTKVAVVLEASVHSSCTCFWCIGCGCLSSPECVCVEQWMEGTVSGWWPGCDAVVQFCQVDLLRGRGGEGREAWQVKCVEALHQSSQFQLLTTYVCMCVYYIIRMYMKCVPYYSP